jgi:hypothetical protein
MIKSTSKFKETYPQVQIWQMHFSWAVGGSINDPAPFFLSRSLLSFSTTGETFQRLFWHGFNQIQQQQLEDSISFFSYFCSRADLELFCRDQ